MEFDPTKMMMMFPMIVILLDEHQTHVFAQGWILVKYISSRHCLPAKLWKTMFGFVPVDLQIKIGEVNLCCLVFVNVGKIKNNSPVLLDLNSIWLPRGDFIMKKNMEKSKTMGLSSTSIGGGLTLAAGYGSTSGGYVPPTDDAGLSLAVGDCSASQESGILEGGDGASAAGGSITITSGKDLSKYQQPKKWMVTFGQDQLISNNSHKARKQNVFSMPQRRLYWWL